MRIARYWLTSKNLVRRNPTARAFGLYLASFALAGATPFLLLPLLTRRLTPEELGAATGFLVVTSLVANVAGLSAHGLVSVRYFKLERPDFARLAAAALRAIVIAHVLGLMLMIPVSPWLRDSFQMRPLTSMLAVLAALLLCANQMFLAMYQVSGRPEKYLRARAIQSLVELSLCVLLLWFVVQDERARVYSYVAAVLLASAYGFGFARGAGLVTGKIERKTMTDVLRFGLPMIPHVLAGTAIAYLDRVVVGGVLGAAALGLYTAALQIGMAMTLVLEPLNKAFVPWLFGKLALNDAQTNRAVVRLTYAFYLALFAFGALVAVAGTQLFETIVGPEYRSAKSLVPVIVLGFVFQGMYYSVVNYVFYSERTGQLSLVTGSVALAGAAISYLAVSHCGIMGAAVAFAINNLLLFLAVWWASARMVPMPWGLRA